LLNDVWFCETAQNDERHHGQLTELLERACQQTICSYVVSNSKFYLGMERETARVSAISVKETLQHD